jgi:hypothetical protein
VLKMSANYRIEPIGPETIDRAYPLAQAVVPSLSKQEWSRSCRSPDFAEDRASTLGEGEEVVVARNSRGYVKGLCIYAVRDHVTYGRLIDVPFFIASSAADGEGVAKELINFLMGKCDRSVCAGIRIWVMSRETWAHRHSPSHIAQSDCGLFLPALADATGAMKSLRACGLSITQAIDRLSR